MELLSLLRSCITALVIIVATDNVRAAIDADTNLMWIEQYSNDSRYMSIKPGDPLSEPISNRLENRITKHTPGARSVTFAHRRDRVYYIDRDTILTARLETLTFSKVHEGLGVSVQIAVDWTVGNVYWADFLFNWVAVKSLPKADVYDFRVLVDKNVERPTGIAVDPRRGYLYWCEAGKTPKVQRSSMAGESPEVIVVGGVYLPKGMTIDPGTGRVYWVDSVKETLEIWDPSKRTRQVLVRDNGAVFVQSAFYKGSIFVTDRASKVIKVFKDGTGEKQQQSRVLGGKPLGIAVYSAENQPSLTDPCAGLACDHYCFAEKDNRTSGRCICQEGFELQPDGKSCSDSAVFGNKLLILASASRLHVLNITIFPRGSTDLKNRQNITAIAVDSNNRLIYFAEQRSGKISSYSLHTEEVLAVTTAGNVAGMVYDWLSETLYWTNSDSGSIQLYRVTSGVKSVVLQHAGENLGPIALNPFTRRLYWITGSPWEIKTRSYDPYGQVTTLATTSWSQPGDLHCDPVQKRLYWTGDGSIEGISLDGTHKKTHLQTVDSKIKSLVVYKQLFFWSSEVPANAIERLKTYINSGTAIYNKPDLRLRFSVPVIDMAVMDASTQQPTRGVCFENGGCGQDCVPKSSGGRECRCELGYTLQSDGQTCGTVEMAGEHLLVRDRVAKKLYQVDMSTGDIHAKFPENDSMVALATNPESTLIYWSDINGRTIMSSNLSGADVTTVFDIETEGASSVAVDPVTGNIYYTAAHKNNPIGNGYVAVLTPDGRMRKTLVSKGLNVPKAIQLHSAKGLMFWAETKNGIWRANMDGSDPSRIISQDVTVSNGAAINTNGPSIGIVVDTEADHLYWFDGSSDVIKKCSLAGESCEVIVTDPGAGITSLVVAEDKLYYTTSKRGGIIQVHKTDEKGRRLLVASAMIGKLQDLFALTPNKRSSVQNECSNKNGGCSAFCLPTSTGKTCATEDEKGSNGEGASSTMTYKQAVLIASVSSVATIALVALF